MFLLGFLGDENILGTFRNSYFLEDWWLFFFRRISQWRRLESRQGSWFLHKKKPSLRL